MRWLAPAKINLHLRVGRRRDDGFHPLCSWMVTIGLFDRLVLKHNPAGVSSAKASSGSEPASSATALTPELAAMPPAGHDPPGTGPAGHPSTGERGGVARNAGPDAHPSRAEMNDGASGVGVVAAELPLRCDDPTIPTDDRNLVTKAARAFMAATGAPSMGRRSLPWSITLLKSIPHGGGLGGGSSDAATTLVALNQLSETGWAVERLAAVGATVGSDVPFFFSAPSAIVRGRGERVRQTPAPAVKWVSLVLPAMAVSTAECYRRFDVMGLGDDTAVDAEPDWAAWATLSAAELSAKLVNDLEPPAFDMVPELGKLRDRIERDTKHLVRMSGSGSSLFVLADDPAEASQIVSTVQHNCGVRAMVVQLAPEPA